MNENDESSSSGSTASSSVSDGDVVDGANLQGDSPLQLIKLQSGKLEIVEETAQFLSTFNCPITVIGIAGVIGSGKSYLLNRYASF